MSANPAEVTPAMPKVPPPSDLAARTLVQERVFDAPPELVWKAFTEPEHLDQWWGPNGFRNKTSALKLEVGGTWRYEMIGPDGKVWPNWIRFQQIVKPKVLVYDHGGEGDEPHFHVTVTFTPVGEKTRVTLSSLFPSAEAVAAVKKFGAVEGGFQTLARLSGHLLHLKDGTHQGAMVLTRVYEAPARLVFQAWSSAEALKKWWGPQGCDTPEAEVDFRVGGRYRIVMRNLQNGERYPFHGTYREIVPDRRIVFHAVLEHLPGVEVTTTVTFVEENGKTLLTVRSDKPSDPAAGRGQTEGWSGQLEKLAAVL